MILKAVRTAETTKQVRTLRAKIARPATLKLATLKRATPRQAIPKNRPTRRIRIRTKTR